MSMTSRKRLELTFAGEPADHTPVALWRHFPVDDQNPELLAASILNFQSQYNFDLVKVTPASSFCVKDWGSRDVWRGSPEGVREFTHFPIQEPDDWKKITPLDPRKGALGEQLRCLALIRKGLPAGVPFIQTIFSPLAQMKNLVGKSQIVVHLRSNQALMHQVLRAITQTTLDFIKECKKTGMDGIFYAEQHAQIELLTADEFAEFCRPYDLQIFDAASDCWCNVLHIHGEHIRFEQFLDYPAQIINWHDRTTFPSISQARLLTDKTLCGGISQWSTLTYKSAEEVSAEALNALQQSQGRRFILGTGCVLPIIASHGNIQAVTQAARSFEV